MTRGERRIRWAVDFFLCLLMFSAGGLVQAALTGCGGEPAPAEKPAEAQAPAEPEPPPIVEVEGYVRRGFACTFMVVRERESAQRFLVVFAGEAVAVQPIRDAARPAVEAPGGAK